jgi:hypothetical protein
MARIRSRSVTNKELAQMKVLTDLGHSPSSIGKIIGRSHHTTTYYLKEKIEVFNDPEVRKLIEVIKKKELDELFLIGEKARTVLNNYLDDCIEGTKQPNPIAIVAIQDRSFQQRRLLEGSATEIFDMRQYEALEKEIQETARKIIELKKEEGEQYQIEEKPKEG